MKALTLQERDNSEHNIYHKNGFHKSQELLKDITLKK